MSRSKSYDYVLPSHLKCWTTCPLRISIYEDVAKQSTLELLQEWQAHGFPTLPDPHLKLSTRRYGHLIAVCVPEALSDRIGPLSKMIDLLLLADELAEGLDQSKVNSAMDCLSSATLMNPDINGLKIVRSHVDQEILQKDEVLGFQFVHAMRNYWNLQKAFARQLYQESRNFIGYMPLRYCNFGGPLIRYMLSFGANLDVTEYDVEAIRVPLFASTIASILWNDMYSWPKEADEYQKDPGAYPINAIGALMKEYSVDSEEGLRICQRKILQFEMKCLKSTEELLSKDDHQLSPSGRDMVRCCPLFASGNALWSCTSDRFQTVELPEYDVLHRVLSAELPCVELDKEFEEGFAGVFQACREIEDKCWERSEA